MIFLRYKIYSAVVEEHNRYYYKLLKFYFYHMWLIMSRLIKLLIDLLMNHWCLPLINTIVNGSLFPPHGPMFILIQKKAMNIPLLIVDCARSLGQIYGSLVTKRETWIRKRQRVAMFPTGARDAFLPFSCLTLLLIDHLHS